MSIKNYFKTLVDKEGSDLFLRSNAIPRARINGQVENIANEPISIKDMQGMTQYLLAKEEQQQRLKDYLDVDFIHVEEGVGRFRVNVFMQRGTPAVVARHVSSNIKSLEELNLPVEVLKLVCEETKGMFLVCGPAGNGKSTTLASMIEYINSISSKHIITIEDPIEYLFTDDKSIINQRELGLDVVSYTTALTHVTQQSPDIIYIGNIRNEGTMKASITATELGTFVMSTFHTINSVQTIVRIVNFFPPHLHDEVRMQLSMILRGTLSLRLVPRKDGQGRIPAYETMMVTPTISRLIREGRIGEIQGFIDQGEMFGMQSFKQSLVGLVKNGFVDQDVARGFADSKDEFDLAMKGIK